MATQQASATSLDAEWGACEDRETGRISTLSSGPFETIERYLRLVGVTIDEVRLELLREVEERLNKAHKSTSQRTREVRALACVERVLCERLGARPGTDTTDPDTARRRLLFSINPTADAQWALVACSSEAKAGERRTVKRRRSDPLARLVRIPPVTTRRAMPRQDVQFRRPPWHRLRRHGIG